VRYIVYLARDEGFSAVTTLPKAHKVEVITTRRQNRGESVKPGQNLNG
jgi:hypothetical protein